MCCATRVQFAIFECNQHKRNINGKWTAIQFHFFYHKYAQYFAKLSKS